jgi:hypothetical protein
MAIPKFSDIFTELLDVLKTDGVLHRRDLTTRVVDQMVLTEEERSATFAGGTNIARNRVHWALEFLCQAEAVSRPKRGYAEKADDEGRLSDIVVVDPRVGALTQIFEEYRPEGVSIVIDTVVKQVDDLVEPVRGTGWQTSHPGDRTVRQELRLILRNNGLPPAGDLFDRAYAYIRENY